MGTIELRNDFHNTTCRVATARLSPSTWRRVRRELCGRSGCTCGIVRGPQAERLVVEADGRGGAQITVEQRACKHGLMQLSGSDVMAACGPGSTGRDDSRRLAGALRAERAEARAWVAQLLRGRRRGLAILHEIAAAHCTPAHRAAVEAEITRREHRKARLERERRRATA